MGTTPPAARSHRLRIPQWAGEIVLVAAIYVAYELLRGVHEGGPGTARSIGRTLLSWERTLHIDPEKWLTIHLDKITWLAVPACYLYATAHYVITPIVLIWLYNRHRYSYGRGRTWLAVTTLSALLVFFLVPTAPPRLLDSGFPDVMADMSRYGWWGNAGSAPRGFGQFTNQFAAMPSMHVGWALWCGIMVWRCAPYLWVRLIGAAYPVITALVVMSTGNHYVLDVVGGVATLAIGAALTKGGYRVGKQWKARRAGRYDEVPAPTRLIPPRAERDASQPADDAAGQDPQARAQNSLHTTSG